VDRYAALVVLRQAPVHVGELAGRRRRGRRELVRRLEAAEELVIGDVDPVSKGLIAEQHLERDHLDLISVAPFVGQVRRGVGDDGKPATHRLGCYSTDRMNG
jgi:hypothetical protein